MIHITATSSRPNSLLTTTLMTVIYEAALQPRDTLHQPGQINEQLCEVTFRLEYPQLKIQFSLHVQLQN